MIATQTAAPEQRTAAARDGAKRLADEAKGNATVLQDPVLKKFYRRALARLGADGDVRWLRVRSRLPLWSGSASVASAGGGGGGATNWWLWWGLFVILSSVTRSCHPG
ncbi:hypothetical protein [Oleiharenicola sp. Vm1]|uniref:hypothetical protein n=1 Tax=Oleiharenicola sp. Vm1 TaxID=3398393 RepID=UPI0039F59478